MFDPSRTLPYFTQNFGVASGPGGSVQVVKGNPNRVYLSCTNFTAQTLYLWPMQPTSPSQGYIALPATSTFEFHWSRHGALVTLPWWGSSSNSGQTIYFMELSFYPPRGRPWVAG